MPIFQYPAKVQPVSTLKESVTADRWLPTYPQPARPLRGCTPTEELVLFLPAVVKPLPFSLASFPETTTESRWHPTYPQPIRYARGVTPAREVVLLVPAAVVPAPVEAVAPSELSRRTLYLRAGSRNVA